MARGSKRKDLCGVSSVWMEAELDLGRVGKAEFEGKGTKILPWGVMHHGDVWLLIRGAVPPDLGSDWDTQKKEVLSGPTFGFKMLEKLALGDL